MSGIGYISSADVLVCVDEIAAVRPVVGTEGTTCDIILKGSGQRVRFYASSSEIISMMREAME